MNQNQTTAQAFPLQWPQGWPRTESFRREEWPNLREVAKALKELRREIELMGGKGLVLSSNCSLGDNSPTDPGVVAYFQWNNQAMAIPCDRWKTVAGNLRAITLTVEALRGLERWGAKHMIQAMFNGFKQLPAKATGVAWWETLGVTYKADAETIKRAYREKAKTAHPDAGGSHERMAELNEAFEAAMNQSGRVAA